MTNTPNREQWLATLTAIMRHSLFANAGATIPDNVKASCSFPSRSATARKKRRIGECWDASRSATNHFEIFISPVLAETLDAAETLAHELVHATVGLKAKHGAKFKKLALAIGLEGKMTATTPGPAFKEWLAPVIADIGPYPHGALDVTQGEKKQTTRLLKVSCPHCAAEGEPYIVRMSSAALEIGAPICPIHASPLEEG